jgi:FkbM family methyltransferase
MPPTRSLQQELIESSFTYGYRREGPRLDTDRFPAGPPPSLPRRAASRLKGYLWNILFKSSFEQMAATHVKRIAKQLELLPRLEALDEKLADERSREVLRAVTHYRILGHQRYTLPLNTDEYWRKRDSIRDYVASPRELKVPCFLDIKLAHYDLSPLGFPMQLFNHASAIQPVFMLEQYRYKGSTSVCAEPGDYVIDAGGCWGEVAFYFAEKIGPDGRVFSFEFIPDNTIVFRENLALNAELGARVELIEQPVWSKSGVTMHYKSNGPGSRVSFDPLPDESGSVSSIALSDFVEQRRLPRVDFIKMDIEGAELDALHGAADIIKKHRPKLAISVYHKPEHFVEIPEFLESLDLGYRFYLDHFTTYMEETVLFATAR